MQVQTTGIDILPDNEALFLSMLQGVIESVDELCCLEVTKLRNVYQFRIAPSVPMYNNLLLQEILKLHNMFNIKVDLSKSIKSSGSLAFSIDV